MLLELVDVTVDNIFVAFQVGKVVRVNVLNIFFSIVERIYVLNTAVSKIVVVSNHLVALLIFILIVVIIVVSNFVVNCLFISEVLVLFSHFYRDFSLEISKHEGDPEKKKSNDKSQPE